MEKGLFYLDSVKCHSCLWDRWQGDDDLGKRIREAIDDKKVFLNLLKKYVKYLLEEKKAHPKVLEEGCGTAIDSCVLKREIPDIDSYAIDLSKESIELAKKISNLMKISLILEVCDACSIKFDSDYFDMVFSQGLVEHLDDPTAFLLEQKRVLKKGGLSIISVPQKYSLFTLFKRMKMRLGKWAHGWEREYTFKELIDIGMTAGFKVLEIDGYEFTIEGFIRNGIRRVKNKFFNKHLSKPALYILNSIFYLWSILLGKSLRKYFCKNLVAVFEK